MSHLTNPLATPAQLYALNTLNSPLPPDLQNSIRFYTARLTQAAGLLLRLSQDITAQANILLYRYWLVDPLLAWEFSVRIPPGIALGDADFVLGCISKRPLPSSQDLRIPTFLKEHNKRIRLPPLPLLPPLAATTNQPLRNASRPRILLPLRNLLHLLPQSPPKHRRPGSQRSRIQHTRCSPSSARNHLSPNSRRLHLIYWQTCGEEDGGVS
jgi:hypothetical protein